MGEQTLLYCTGAAKAGTSWLFDYLRTHPDCYFPTTKELHYWDGVKSGRGAFFRDQLPGRIADIRSRYIQKQTPEHLAYQEASMDDIRRWYDAFDGATRDDQMYLDYIGIGRAGAQVVGDFTPAYAALPPDWLRRMVGVYPRVKVIYLLREPVDRLWSHMRMDAGAEGAQGALSRFDDFLAGGQKTVAQRSNYRQAVNRLREVVAEEDLLITYYERLFTDETVRQVTDFLGISAHAAQFKKAVHASKPAALDAARRQKAQHLLRQQYNFVERRLGGLPPEWVAKML